MTLPPEIEESLPTPYGPVGPVKPFEPPDPNTILGRVWWWLFNHIPMMRAHYWVLWQARVLKEIDALTNEEDALKFTVYTWTPAKDALLTKARVHGWNRVFEAYGEEQMPRNVGDMIVDALGLHAILGPAAASFQTLFKTQLMDKASEIKQQGDLPGQALRALGSFIYGNVAEAIVGPGKPLPEQSMPAIQRFIGTVTLLTGLPQILAGITETASRGALKSMGNNIQNIYWNLGLGFLTWQALAPLLQSVILEPLQREMDRLYRPRRFTDAQAGDLHALGVISDDEFRDVLRDNGWREEDIDKVIDLSFTELSQGQILSFLNKGIIDEKTAFDLLIRLGYRPKHVTWILIENALQQAGDQRGAYIGTLRKAFKVGRLTEDQFRSMLSQLGLMPEAIQLEVDLIKLDREEEAKDLTLSQIKAAYVEGILNEQEVRTHLQRDGYQQNSINILLQLWNREREPEFRKLNQRTIVSAFVEGVIDESEARERLRDLRFSPDSIDIIIRQAIPKRELKLQPPSRPLTQGAIHDAWLAEVIDDNVAAQKLRELGFDDEDIRILLETWREEVEELTAPRERLLNQGSVLAALRAGVIEEAHARSLLLRLEIAPENVDILIQTTLADMQRPIPVVSVSALQRALRNGIIDSVTFERKLAERGFPPEERDLFRRLALFEPPPKEPEPPPVREIPRELVLEMWQNGVLTRLQAQERLIRLGFRAEDAELILRNEEVQQG